MLLYKLSGVMKIDDYNWTDDAIASYAPAIQTHRERYLEDRLPGESAKEWLDRLSSK